MDIISVVNQHEAGSLSTQTNQESALDYVDEDNARLEAKMQLRRQQLANGVVPDPRAELAQFRAEVDEESLKLQDQETTALIDAMNQLTAASKPTKINSTQDSTQGNPDIINEQLNFNNIAALDEIIQDMQREKKDKLPDNTPASPNRPVEKTTPHRGITIYIHNSTVNIYN